MLDPERTLDAMQALQIPVQLKKTIAIKLPKILSSGPKH
jgi:hypothetical protein